MNFKHSKGPHITISLILIGWFQVARLEIEGVRVGDQYHTPHFVGDVALLASRYVRNLDMHDLQCKLGGLGIRSNLAILADGVPVGLILGALHNIRHSLEQLSQCHGVPPGTLVVRVCCGTARK